MDLMDANWRKSSFSGSNGRNCLEVAELHNGWGALRDTERPDLEPFVVRPAVWKASVLGVKAGEFDPEA